MSEGDNVESVGGEGVGGNVPRETKGVMRERSKEEWREMKEKYLVRLEDEAFFRMTQGQQAREMGVSMETIKKWRATTDWKERTGKYREKYWYFGPQVDMAVIRRALTGDMRAAELYYARFEGWVAKSGVELTVGKLDGKTNAELMAEYLREMSGAERAKLMGMGVVEAEVEKREGAA